MFEEVIKRIPDADTYFFCLATLHKARLKYERILKAQSVPTVDQVGPRGLLQYGSLNVDALVAFMFWRKWMFDIDNRAGQETGYVFEPIIAFSIGGVPYGATKSPVHRASNGKQGRQVDCILEEEKKAYELKLRVTIAASGQGRWDEELQFPKDCVSSNYTPVLVVLDPTANPKLDQLKRSFVDAGGEAYIGKDAWDHLASKAGPTMSKFIDNYVHKPIADLLAAAPTVLPELVINMSADELVIAIAGDRLVVARDKKISVPTEDDRLPEDVDQQLPGLL